MSHPEIGSIIRKRDQIHDMLYLNYDPVKALENMIGLHWELEEKHQDGDYSKKLENELNVLGQAESVNRTEYNKLKSKRKHTYWQWLRELNQTLWENDYLYNKRYGAPELKKDRVNLG